MKTGDIVRTNENKHWFSWSADRYFDVPKGTEFIIGDPCNDSYTDITNKELGYGVLMSNEDIDKFFNIKRIRKDKLLKIKNP